MDEYGRNIQTSYANEEPKGHSVFVEEIIELIKTGTVATERLFLFFVYVRTHGRSYAGLTSLEFLADHVYIIAFFYDIRLASKTKA